MVERFVVLLLGVLLCCSNLMSQELEGKTYVEIDALVAKYHHGGAYRKAAVCTDFARERARMDYGEHDSIYIEYTANLGFCYQKSGEYAK